MAKFQRTRIGLNIKKPGVGSFFDPDSGLHLTRELPVKEIFRVTPAICRGLKSATGINSIIDLDNRVDVDKVEFKEDPRTLEVKEEKVEPKIIEVTEEDEVVIPEDAVIIEASEEDEKPKKTSKKDKSKKA